MARIIIADDDKVAQVIYRNAIDFLGHEPVICQNGREAIEAFASEPADLVILDMLMPEMDGIEACRCIRKMPKGAGVPIIIVSGLDDEKDIVRGLNAGANDYLIKPVKDAHLFAKLKVFLRMSSLHRDDFELAKKHAVFADRFKIVKMLGYGTHSIVFLAEDLEDRNNTTALKLFKETAETASVFDSFAETAGKLKQIDSKYVLKIRDFGQCDGRMFVAMDYAGQGDLARVLKKGTCSQLVAARLGFNISSAIRDISLHGIIHFDIKPENVMINDGQYLLGDFGIITTRVSATLPIGREIWSTLAYLPPEYLTEDGMSLGQSDVYSLGITLYEALSGKNPFQSERAGTTMFCQMNLVPPPVTELNPLYDNELSETLAAMLLKKASERPSPDKLVEIFGNMLDRFPKERYRDSPLPILLPAVQEQEPEKMEEAKGVPESGPDKAKPLPSHPRPHGPAKLSWWRKFKKKKKQPRVFHPSPLSQHIDLQVFGQLAGILLKYAVILLLLLLAVYSIGKFGMYVKTSFLSPKEELKGVPTITQCISCNNLEEKTILDTVGVKCSKCESPVGTAYRCKKCGRIFPVGYDGAPVKGRMEEFNCPECSSPDTEIIPSSSEYLDMLIRESEKAQSRQK